MSYYHYHLECHYFLLFTSDLSQIFHVLNSRTFLRFTVLVWCIGTHKILPKSANPAFWFCSAASITPGSINRAQKSTWMLNNCVFDPGLSLTGIYERLWRPEWRSHAVSKEAENGGREVFWGGVSPGNRRRDFQTMTITSPPQAVSG